MQAALQPTPLTSPEISRTRLPYVKAQKNDDPDTWRRPVRSLAKAACGGAGHTSQPLEELADRALVVRDAKALDDDACRPIRRQLDIIVDKIEVALSRAEAAGAVVEQAVRTEAWGKIAVLADPFGHGLCLIEFLNRGYDEIADH